MTNQLSAGPGPGWHASRDLLADYATGAVDEATAWSIEAHVTACAACRSALAVNVDAGRLARNRAVLRVRLALGDTGRTRRRGAGAPGYLLRLLAATPSLRRSWLLSVVGVLAVVAGEAVLASHSWDGVVAGYPRQEALVPFLLVAPLLALAGVAAAFMPWSDPAYLLAAAAPFSGFTLLLVRATSALAAAMVPVACAALAVPGPGWLPAAFVLPSLAVCSLALAAVTVVGPLAAAAVAGTVWVLPVLLLADAHLPLSVVQWHGQAAAAGVLLAATAVLRVRQDRLELGWKR